MYVALHDSLQHASNQPRGAPALRHCASGTAEVQDRESSCPYQWQLIVQAGSPIMDYPLEHLVVTDRDSCYFLSCARLSLAHHMHGLAVRQIVPQPRRTRDYLFLEAQKEGGRVAVLTAELPQLFQPVPNAVRRPCQWMLALLAIATGTSQFCREWVHNCPEAGSDTVFVSNRRCLKREVVAGLT